MFILHLIQSTVLSWRGRRRATRLVLIGMSIFFVFERLSTSFYDVESSMEVVSIASSSGTQEETDHQGNMALPDTTPSSNTVQDDPIHDPKPTIDASCSPMPIMASSPFSEAIWVPAYPGSGSEMFRELIELATGLKAKEVYGNYCIGNRTITCKTHYPAIEFHGYKEAVTKRLFHEFAFLLLRNPATALPSFFNWWYEKKTKQEKHSVQGPVEAWRVWRDESFHRRIKNWGAVIKVWHELNYNVTILPYEHLTGSESGPKLFQQVGRQLQDLGYETASIETLPCLWKRNVVEKAQMKRLRTYVPGYTQEQKDSMLAAIDEIMALLPENKVLADILPVYKRVIVEDIPLDISPGWYYSE